MLLNYMKTALCVFTGRC